MEKRRSKSKVGKKIAKNKVILILFLCFIILVITLFVLLKDYNNDTKALYGDRLDGISEVKLTSSKLDKIDDAIKATQLASSSKAYVEGKILNVDIVIKKSVDRETAKGLSSVVIENLEDDEKKFYDVQIFIDKYDDASFPIIGYRHHNKENFSWTLDR